MLGRVDWRSCRDVVQLGKSFVRLSKGLEPLILAGVRGGQSPRTEHSPPPNVGSVTVVFALDFWLAEDGPLLHAGRLGLA